MLLVVAIAGAVLADTAVMPQPWRGIEHRLLLTLQWPALIILIVLPAAAVGLLVLRSSHVSTLPTVDREEPHLLADRLAAPPRDVEVVTLAGLERGCGVTTLTFNLAVLLAVSGERSKANGARQPLRPACLLSKSPLSEALGLNPQGLEDRLAERPWHVRPDVIELGVRHPSGCAMFCLHSGRDSDDEVRRLVEQLSRHFDAVLVDGAVTRSERLSPVDPSDVLLLVGLPSRSSVERAGRWITTTWGTSRQGTAVVVVNRVPAWPPVPRELLLASDHLLLLAHEPRIADLDRRGHPWSLDDRLAITARARVLANWLLPERSGGDTGDAA